MLEHLATGRFRQRLGRGPWDFVVLQDQGQRPGWPSLTQREQEFFAPARKLQAEIVNAGAKPLLYETFARRDGDPGSVPADDYEAMQARIITGYATIARELDVPVVPVGATWRTMHRAHPEVALWANDGLHPTVAGTYLAACAFFAYFHGQSPLYDNLLREAIFVARLSR